MVWDSRSRIASSSARMLDTSPLGPVSSWIDFLAWATESAGPRSWGILLSRFPAVTDTFSNLLASSRWNLVMSFVLPTTLSTSEPICLMLWLCSSASLTWLRSCSILATRPDGPDSPASSFWTLDICSTELLTPSTLCLRSPTCREASSTDLVVSPCDRVSSRACCSSSANCDGRSPIAALRASTSSICALMLLIAAWASSRGLASSLRSRDAVSSRFTSSRNAFRSRFACSSNWRRSSGSFSISPPRKNDFNRLAIMPHQKQLSET